jgi:D-inositol-3-phosphate glycosyltransferase
MFEVPSGADRLADEFIVAGHDVSILGRDDPPPDPSDVLHAFGWNAVEALGEPQAPAAAVASVDPPGERVDAEAISAGRAYDRVIATSSQAAQRLVAVGMRRDRLAVIPLGVDTGVFHAGPDGPRLHTDRKPPRIVVVRDELIPHDLLDIMIALRRVPDARLFVAGGVSAHRIRRDSGAQEVASAARRIGVAGRVFLVGGVPDERRPELYRGADVVVCTAEPGATRTALEAMACSVPVVAFASGAMTDIIVHGVCGILVDPGDVTALAAALRGLLAAEPRRYAYAVAGLSRVQERFTWPRVAEQIERVYRSAIADRQDRSGSSDSGLTGTDRL